MNQTPRPRGQALVEFALVFPIFLLVLLGLIDIGRGVFSYNAITNAAREGARLAIVNQAVGAVTSRVAMLSPVTPVSTCVVYLNVGQTTSDCVVTRDTVPAAQCDPIKVGCVAAVEARSQFTAITPIIGNLLGPITLTAMTELPIEFVCPNAVPEWSTCPKQP